MLIATATLITLLLFGGPDELFLIGALEKGVKKEIEDKDLKKEIKADISAYKKSVKVYKKQRKAQKKELGTLYSTNSTTREEFSALYKEMHSTLKKLQIEAIETRIKVVDKISEKEWDNIIEIEKERLSKVEQKRAKGKEKDVSQKPFSKFEATIKSLQLDQLIEQEALGHLSLLRQQYKDLSSNIMHSRSKFSEIILEKESSKSELESVAYWNNEIRTKAFDALNDLYLLLSEHVAEPEWNKVAKEFKRVIK